MHWLSSARKIATNEIMCQISGMEVLLSNNVSLDYCRAIAVLCNSALLHHPPDIPQLITM